MIKAISLSGIRPLKGRGDSRPNSRAEDGVAVILTLLVISALLGILAILLNLANHKAINAQLQSAVDAAAHAGSNTFCSTRACFNDALRTALISLQEQLGKGQRGADPFTLNAAAGPVWDLGDFRIIVQRGRWWADGAAASGAAVLGTHYAPPDDNFEPIDLPTGAPQAWQEFNQGTPAFIVANAMYIRVERVHLFDIFALFGRPKAKAAAEIYTIGGSLGADIAVAPFAIPVCSLLNEDGEFDKVEASSFERFFTSVHRLCPSGNAMCDILPGLFWQPLSDGTANKFNSQWYRPQCDWQPSAKAGDVNDHFAVVGLPQSAWETGAAPAGDAAIESRIQALLGPHGSAAAVHIPARIGDRFYILNSGLTGSTGRQIANRLWGVSGTDLQWADDTSNSTPRFADAAWREAPLIDESEAVYFRDTHLQEGAVVMRLPSNFNGTVEAGRGRSVLDCPAAGGGRGVCGSRRFTMRNECAMAAVHNWEPGDHGLEQTCWRELHSVNGWEPSPQLGFAEPNPDWSFASWQGGSLWLPCPVGVRINGAPGTLGDFGIHQPVPASLLNLYYRPISDDALDWYGGFVMNDTFPFSLGSTPYFQESDRRLVHPQVWRVPVPIIADESAVTTGGALYCQGINGNTARDPVVDPGAGIYVVIGFIEVLLFDDSDIGVPGPNPLDMDLSIFEYDLNGHHSAQYCNATSNPPDPSRDTLRSYTAGRMPWGFENSPGNNIPCEMVLGALERESKLISTADFRHDSLPRPRLVSATPHADRTVHLSDLLGE